MVNAWEIGVFRFDYSSLIAFLIGIMSGFAILFLIYVVIVLRSLRKNKKNIRSIPNNTVTDEEIKEIVTNAQLEFKDKNLKGSNATIGFAFEICKKLVTDVARKFYPKSKRPLAELSIDEMLMLMHYIANRINELLDRPVGRIVKKVKLSTILSLGDVKKKLDASALMKATRKYKVKKLFSAMMGALNLINPVYWIRKSVVNGALNTAIKKMCQAVISICGEETYKIYSKKVFNEENMIDLETGKYIGEMDESLKDVSDEEIDEYMKNEKLLLNLEEGDSHEGTNKN